MPDRPASIMFSCEHAGNQVPAKYRRFFSGQRRVLASHRGYDIGILDVAHPLQKALRAPLFTHSITRLLVDTNRSLHHPRLFSEFSRGLPPSMREQIIEKYYLPHREAVENALASSIKRGQPVIHFGLHSFTPVWRGAKRNVDIGLLYDPSRARERTICRELQKKLTAICPEFRIRLNAPYRGASDGLTTTLRKKWPDRSYTGIEIEINQGLLENTINRKEVTRALIRSIQTIPGLSGHPRTTKSLAAA